MIDQRNPYLDEATNPLLLRSVVAFIDILGYEELVLEADTSSAPYDFLAHLRDALGSAIGHLDEKLGEDGPDLVLRLGKKDRYRVRTFTDNIVIGFPVRDDAESELGSVFWRLAFFQLSMVNQGFFLRGGISVGNLFMDERVVFGRGLIEAYRGERERARDPRIILTDSAKAAVKQHLIYYSDPASSPQARELFVDADGQYFLNYLNTILLAENEQGPFYEELEKHKQSVEERLRICKDRPSLWSKYAWVAGYHNFFCDQYSYFSEEYKVDLSKLQMSPSRIT